MPLLPKPNRGRKEVKTMAFPDPYSHLRLAELREEQLSRQAACARAIGLDTPRQSPAREAFAGALRAIADRLAPQPEVPHARAERRNDTALIRKA
jgi:hypothetical protein